MPATLFALLTLHAVLALALATGGRTLGRRALAVAALAPAVTFGWLVAKAPAVLGGAPVAGSVPWVPGMDLSLSLRLDAFGLLMAALISGVGVLIFAYSYFYFERDQGMGRFAATLLAFGGSMLGIVVTDHLLALFVFWELTSITSFLLIGFKDTSTAARSAAMQALLVTALGGLAMMTGFVLIAGAAGTYSLTRILESPPLGGETSAALLLILLGAFTKSAQAPFHFWLPGAMAAPTPVSAYLHSATMVKAGIYLVARFAPAFAPEFRFFTPLVVTVGVATMLVGGYRALRQTDLKLLLAYGTVSQLGFLMALVGAGHPGLTFAGTAMIMAHALFKAALFLIVGIVDHQAHTREIPELSGLGRRMPVLFGTACVVTASMVGLPPTLGYLTKEAALEHLLVEASPWATAGIVAATVLTVAYSARFLWGAFATKADAGTAVGQPARPSGAFMLPALVLAALTLLMGLAPGLSEHLTGAAAAALEPAAGDFHLYLWHGFTAALGLSALTLAGGLLLFRLRPAVQHLQGRLAPPFGAEEAYASTVRGLNALATRVTGVVQNGSLPTYIGIILVTVLGIPASFLVADSSVRSASLVLMESPLQLVVVVGLAAAAVGCAFLNRRFAAVLMLGAVGYSVAILFVIHGAPDLALTQLLVETISLIMFVLVLRHLPEHFEPFPWRLGRRMEVVLSVTVGVIVAGFALVAGTTRHSPPVSQEHIDLALTEGGGRNVVNVILTDFRALDTLGEITVLVVAALGVASLVTAPRRRRRRR